MVHCDKIEIQKVGQDQISRGVCYGFGKQEHFRRDCVQRKDEGFSGYSKNWEKQVDRPKGSGRGWGDRSRKPDEGSKREKLFELEYTKTKESVVVMSGYCGEAGHSMSKCGEFSERFLRCAHCGTKDHASHLCDKEESMVGSLFESPSGTEAGVH